MVVQLQEVIAPRQSEGFDIPILQAIKFKWNVFENYFRASQPQMQFLQIYRTKRTQEVVISSFDTRSL